MDQELQQKHFSSRLLENMTHQEKKSCLAVCLTDTSYSSNTENFLRYESVLVTCSLVA